MPKWTVHETMLDGQFQIVDKERGVLIGRAKYRSAAQLFAASAELHKTVDDLLAAWWQEYVKFFGGSAEHNAQLVKDFEGVPAVIAARAVLAKVEGKPSA